MIKAYQLLLKKLGYNPGPIDGIMGKKTRDAIKAFQQANQLVVDGVIGEETLDLLNRNSDQNLQVVIPWVQEMLRRVGLHENKNQAQLESWLASAGVGVNPSKKPWCGDAVETALLRSLGDIEVPDNPLWALNWEKFGFALPEPIYGAVMVFERPTPQGLSGHVGFYVGEEGKYYRILGGNQSDAINVSKYRKDRLRGIRWPKEFPVINTHQIFGLEQQLKKTESVAA